MENNYKFVGEDGSVDVDIIQTDWVDEVGGETKERVVGGLMFPKSQIDKQSEGWKEIMEKGKFELYGEFEGFMEQENGDVLLGDNYGKGYNERRTTISFQEDIEHETNEYTDEEGTYCLMVMYYLPTGCVYYVAQDLLKEWEVIENNNRPRNC